MRPDTIRSRVAMARSIQQISWREGSPFGPIISANITPDASGKPAGLDFDEYLELIRTGHDPDEPDEILQVMPWPIFRNMNDRDILAIYTYLSSIPHAEPGTCTGPGQ